MEQQIQDLVDSIRKEGIDKARLDADKIISEAEARAKAIIEDAEKEKEKLLAGAASSIDTERASAEASIKQAARDVSLSLKKSIEDAYTRILKAGCGSAKLLYAGELKKTANWKEEMHSHPFCEIVFVKSGTGVLHTETADFPADNC